MKRLFLIIAILVLFAGNVYAINWLPLTQGTAYWDEVKLTKAGQELNKDDIIKYNTYIKLQGPGEKILYSLVTGLQETFTFPSPGKWIIGLQSVRFIKGEGEGIIAEEDITWSDSADPIAVPNPFGFIFYVPAGIVKNLRP